MNNHRIFRVPCRLPAGSFAIVLAMILTSTIVFASTPQGSFDKTFTVSGAVNLEVLTHSGDIIVRNGPSGTVSVHGKIYVGNRWLSGQRQGDVAEIEHNPPLRQEGNSIHIDYVNERDISVSYEITVPADTTVRTHSGSGDQTVEGVRGNADLESGSGDMRLSQLAGEIRVQTGSGNVRAQELSGPFHARAGSGDIELEETGAGEVDLRTGSGNVTARGVNGAFHGEAGSGDITAEGTQTGRWEIRTGSGNVHVRLAANSAFDADLSTSSGTLDVDAPVTMTVQGRVRETKAINGKVRGGGPLLSVRTGSGDIHVQ